MSKFTAKLFLKTFGWNTTKCPDLDKFVVGVAPHTSMWDFLWGRAYIISEGYKPKVLIKKEVFFFPLGLLLKSLGGVPVDRRKPKGLTEMIVAKFNENEKFVVGVTPEGTRSKVKKWKKGFIHIARAAKVPIVVGYIDYKTKTIGVLDTMSSDGDVDEIMRCFKQKFTGITGKHPEKFTNEHD